MLISLSTSDQRDVEVTIAGKVFVALAEIGELWVLVVPRRDDGVTWSFTVGN